MNHSSAWQPVVPSHHVRVADNIVAGFLNAGELAVWRGSDGTVQAWENRCPHRGTRLTMGRIIDGNLSCAYHGWEFGANGGRCCTIPAQPSSPAPKNLCVTTYAANEAAGMIWVRPNVGESAAAMPAIASAGTWFCRSLGVQASAERVEQELSALHFDHFIPSTWSGALAFQRATLFVGAVSDGLTLVHVWLAEKPQPQQLRSVTAALARLRDRSEKPKAEGVAA